MCRKISCNMALGFYGEQEAMCGGAMRGARREVRDTITLLYLSLRAEDYGSSGETADIF